MAMAPVLIGRNVSVAVYGGTDDGTGTITWASSVSLAGKAERVEERLRRETERIEAMDATIENNVPIIDGWTLNVSAIKRKAGTTPNPLESLFLNYTYAKVVITTPTSVRTYRGVAQELGIMTEQRKNTDSFGLVPIDDGSANPTVAAP